MELTRSTVQDFVAKGAKDAKVPTVEEACLKAQRQAEKSFLIGERKTPAVSFWPITLKKSWALWGQWWTCIATGGDTTFKNGVGVIEPMMIQLFYVRIGNYVMQLAWERPDIDFRADRSITYDGGKVTV